MDPRQLEEEVDTLEPKVERLKALYEQYFLGLEKLEPTTLRSEVDRKFTELRKRRIQSTRVRYRLQMLIQRYNTYQQYWARVTREMERGTYMRDVLRVAKRIGSKEAMTILGQRRVRMFRELARVQEERRDRRKDGSASNDGGGAELGDAAQLEDPTQWNIFADDSAEPAQPPVATAPTRGPPENMRIAYPNAPAPRPGRGLEDDDAPTLPPPATPKGVGAPPLAIPKAPLLPEMTAETPPPIMVTRKSSVFITPPSITPSNVPASTRISFANSSPASAAFEIKIGSIFDKSPPTSSTIFDFGFA